MNLPLPGLEGKTAIVTGHTQGIGLAVHDLLSASGDPHVQRSYAHNWQEIGHSLQRLQQYEPQVLYAGHGDEPITADDVDDLTEEYLQQR